MDTFERWFALFSDYFSLVSVPSARPLEECVVTVGGFGGKIFEVTPDEGVVVGAPLALTIRPEAGDAVR